MDGPESPAARFIRMSRVSPATLFLFLSIGFGLTFIALSPPFQAPDEPAHFLRSWAISEGKVRSESAPGAIRGAYVPRALLDTIRLFFGPSPHARSLPADLKVLRAAFEMPLEPDDRVFIAAPGHRLSPRISYSAAGYPPMGYLPSSAAILGGRLLEASPVALLYAARVTNLLLGTFIGWLAIRRTPWLRWSFAWCLLLPMAVYMRGSVNPDSLLISLAFLVAAEVLRVASSTSGGFPLWLLAATALFGAIKPGYPLVPLLGLAIPPHRLGGGWRWVRYAAALLTVVALGIAITFAFLQGAKTATHGSVEEESASRLQAVIAAPAAFTLRATAFWLDELGLRMEEFVGNLGWLDTRLPSVAVLLALWVLFALSQVDGMRGRPGLRGAAAALFLTTIALLTLHTHLASRPEHFIDGFQGRYLLPLAPLLLVAAGRRTERLDQPALPAGVAVLAFLLLATASFVLFGRYWG